MRPQRLHMLRPNESTKTPHLVYVVDCESRWQQEQLRELQTLRLWCGRAIRRHGKDPRRARQEDVDGRTVEQLADSAELLATKDAPVWLFTHNLSYDLGLTKLPLILLDRGWTLGMHNLASDEPWAILRKDRRTIRLADSHSWLQCSVETLGAKLEIPKVELPENDDSEEAWLARCWGDVEILSAALTRLLDLWDDQGLGHWAVTGPGSGWNAMRHMWASRPRLDPEELPAGTERAMSLKVDRLPVVDPDPEARSFERSAIVGGRRELFRVGVQPVEPYIELDLKTAHLAVCASFPVPCQRLNRYDELPVDGQKVESRHLGLLGSCLVRTETPRYPLRTRHGVTHPVGTFRTVLAGPELREARRRGELLQVGPVYTYALGTHMQPWARWALDVLNAPPGAVDPLLQVVVKGWSRTVPGRWGMLVSREGLSGESEFTGWRVEEAAFGYPPKPGWLLWLGGRWTELIRDQDSDNAFPAVLAYVQSWVRLLIGRLLDRLGPDAVLQVNTDSLLVRWRCLEQLLGGRGQPVSRLGDIAARVPAALRELEQLLGPLHLGVKAISPELRLLSPQHLEFAGERRFAGVPRKVEAQEGDKFTFWTWPKLRGQMERGDPRGYVRELRTVDLSGIATTRWTYGDGCTAPPRSAQAAPSGSGPTWSAPEPHCPHGAALSPRQHPALTRP